MVPRLLEYAEFGDAVHFLRYRPETPLLVNEGKVNEDKRRTVTVPAILQALK